MAGTPSERKSPSDGEKLSPCQVTYFVEDRTYQGTSAHFSEMGMLVLCRQPLPLNTVVRLVLEFTNIDKPLEVGGEVVWTNMHGPEDNMSPRGMGIKFSQDDPDVLRVLGELARLYDSPDNLYRCFYS